MTSTNMTEQVKSFYYGISQDIDKFAQNINSSFSDYKNQFIFVLEKTYDNEIKEILTKISHFLLALNKEDRLVYAKLLFREIDYLYAELLMRRVSWVENDNLFLYNISDDKRSYLVYYNSDNTCYSDVHSELIGSSNEKRLAVINSEGYLIFMGFVLFSQEIFLRGLNDVLRDFDINLVNDIINYHSYLREDYSFLSTGCLEIEKIDKGNLLSTKQVLILCLEILSANNIDKENTKLTELARLIRLITNKGDKIDVINNTGTYSGLKDLFKDEGYKDTDLITIYKTLNKLGFGKLAKKFTVDNTSKG